jgi:FAD/FMN-containing dehydrogenase
MVAHPIDAEDVSTVLSWAFEHEEPVVPRGAGTGMPGGNVGRGIALDLSTNFRGLEPADVSGRTVRVEPGVLVGDVDRAARRVGLFFPPLPSSADRCTVGGVVANNAAGARSFKYGATRDWVQTLDVVAADGSQYRLGKGHEVPAPFDALHKEVRAKLVNAPTDWPNVRKNSSGYALDRFLPDADAAQLVVGSEGTLAVVTSATLMLAPVPEAAVVVLIAVRNLLDLPILLQWARDTGASACEFFGRRFLEVASHTDHPLGVGGAAAALLVELDGDVDAVSTAADSLSLLARELRLDVVVGREESDRKSLWNLRHAASPLISDSARAGLVSTQIIEDSVVPPEALGAYLSGVDDILHATKTDAVVFGHAGDANIHVNPLLDVRRSSWRDDARTILTETVDLVADLGGTLSGEHGDGRLRAPFVEQIWGSRLTRCFETVKATLDPTGILNPGVIIPLPDQDPLEGLWPQFGGTS